jgi:hypothetical protein
VGLASEFMFLKKDGTPAKAINLDEALVERCMPFKMAIQLSKIY